MGSSSPFLLLVWASACLLLPHGSGAQGALLAPLVRQEDYDAVVANLGMGSLPDEADETGDTALLAAAETGNTAIAEELLLYHANGSLPAPTSGRTPFVAAALRLDQQTVRVLLKYGTSPDAVDLNGDTPRKVILDHGIDTEEDAKVDAILELLNKFDAEGAEAFEDPPGTWQRLESEKHQGATFFYNKATDTSTYLPPTSCSWIKTEHPDHNGAPLYVNLLTKQTRWTRPKALVWHYTESVSSHSKGFWHNPHVKVSQWATPGEPSPEMIEEMQLGFYWHNVVTGESTWEDPMETRWRQLMDEHGAYWFHPRTGKSTRTPPEELQGWQQFWSEKESKFYYVRHADGTTQWDPPAPFAWERYASEPLPSEPKSAANARDEL